MHQRHGPPYSFKWRQVPARRFVLTFEIPVFMIVEVRSGLQYTNHQCSDKRQRTKRKGALLLLNGLPVGSGQLLRARPGKKSGSSLPVRGTQHEPDLNDHIEQWLVCANCGSRITRPVSRISVDGSHRHTFANPLGVVFEIGCFAPAPGCLVTGEATADFTWFRGYKWRIAICASCYTHLGWRFEAGHGDAFFGLILDRLRSSLTSGNRHQ